MHHFRLEIAGRHVRRRLIPALARLTAVPEAQRRCAARRACIEGEIPAARVQTLRQQLPALTRGEGVMESAFERYRPARGTPPTRPRTDHNPLDRKEYLLHVLRRV